MTRPISLAILLLAVPPYHFAGEPAKEAVAAADWDAVFDRKEGWIGGDAIYSTPLPPGEVLWLFADTFIGNVENGRRQPGLRMVNNTLARHKLPVHGQAPDSDAVRFLWGGYPDLRNPTAWIAPETPPPVAFSNSAGKDAAKKPVEWYWLADAIVAPAALKRERLVFFLWRMTRTSESGAFGFRSVGVNLAIIDDPGADWSTWKPKQFAVAHAIPSSIDDSRRRPEVVWGSEVLLEPRDSSARTNAQNLLIFGYRIPAKGFSQLIAARAPADAIEQMDRWQFRTVDGWSSKLDDAVSLTEGITTEFSICPIQQTGAPLWALIQSEPFLGERIMARTSKSPLGPWSKPKPVYRVPNLDRAKKHFTYAAKAHPELSRPGELLISYVVNSMDFGESANNSAVYRPRFLRVPVSLLPPPE